jgi:hypothetical protein
MPLKKILNLGCGRVHRPDAVNVDAVPSVGADIVHDLNLTPWPFPDGWFKEVHANDVIEHLHDTVTTMKEIHRVCENGAVVRLTVPHFSSVGAFVDPTHRRFFAAGTFDYFKEGHHLNYYGGGTYEVRNLQIVFWHTPLNKVVWRLANRYREAYERRWAWLFPARFLYVELGVIKR